MEMPILLRQHLYIQTIDLWTLLWRQCITAHCKTKFKTDAIPLLTHCNYVSFALNLARGNRNFRSAGNVNLNDIRKTEWSRTTAKHNNARNVGMFLWMYWMWSRRYCYQWLIYDCVSRLIQTEFQGYKNLPSNLQYIRSAKSQNLNDFRPVLQISLPYPLKPGVKSRLKM